MRILHVACLHFNYPNGLTNAVLGHFNSQIKYKEINDEVYLLNVSQERINRQNVIHLVDLNNSDLENIIKESDIVIFHGVFYTYYMKIYRLVKKHRIKYVIVPHSSLTRQALSKSRIKEYLFFIIFLNRFIKNSSAIHFLSQQEKMDSIFNDHNNFVIPNGVKIPTELKVYKNNKHDNPLIVGFVGRLDIFQKGLDLLLDLIKDFVSNSNYKNQFKFYIYGPDYRGNMEKMIKLINERNLNEYVKLKGPVYDNEKYDAYRNIDVFIHTSRFEGLPMSILEALSVGLPCIVTKGTNFEESIRQYNAGWCLSDMNFQDILEEICLNKEILVEKSNNARNMIKKYSWQSISSNLLNTYKNIVYKN